MSLVPILQATQNQDGAVLQATLDERIKANVDPRDAMIGVEQKGQEEIESLRLDVTDPVAKCG